MKKPAVVIAALVLGVLGAPAARADGPALLPAPPAAEAKPLMGREHVAKLQEEAHLHEQRAHEIEPILSRDRQARHDVEMDWIVLERHARDLHQRANDFRSYAGEVGGRAQNDMNTFATELDQFAIHDEENARWQHEMAQRLDSAIQASNTQRDWHLKMAQRIRDWLASNGN